MLFCILLYDACKFHVLYKNLELSKRKQWRFTVNINKSIDVVVEWMDKYPIDELPLKKVKEKNYEKS